jgi:hypothetical protein
MSTPRTRTADTPLEQARAALNGTNPTDNEIAIAAWVIEHTGASPGRLAGLAMEIRAVGKG